MNAIILMIRLIGIKGVNIIGHMMGYPMVEMPRSSTMNMGANERVIDVTNNLLTLRTIFGSVIVIVI